MKRLEIIHLRLAGGCPEGLIGEIRRSAATRQTTMELKIYRHATVATDIGIHILHEPNEAKKLPGQLGTLLASALREHGMVEHSVWIEEEAEVSR